MLRSMKFSLVIPCYNEAKNLPLLIDRCRQYNGGCGEFVLVDNGSSDGSWEVLERGLAGSSFIRSVRVNKNQGYGFGILSGLRSAEGEVLGWSHADMQTDPLDAAAAFEFFQNAEAPEKVFVKGRRYGRPMADRLFTAGMTVFETALMGVPLRDVNAQPTMFHRSFFQTFDDAPYDFSLDLYAYMLAKRMRLTVRRFPVRFGERAHGVSHWNVDFKAKMKFIKRTTDYSFKLRRDLKARSLGKGAENADHRP